MLLKKKIMYLQNTKIYNTEFFITAIMGITFFLILPNGQLSHVKLNTSK